MSEETDNETTDAVEAKELPWTDSAIRWTAEENKYDTTDDDDQEGGLIDPFADPDPSQIFDFSFPVPLPLSSSSSSSEKKCIDISLRGYKYESDQTWNSTGLTLWKAAEHLCQYLIHQPLESLQGKRILELGAGLGLVSILTYLWMYQSDDDIENSMPSNIFVTDGDTDTLTQLRANVEQHCLPAATGRSTISCYQLLWGTETTKQFQRQQQRNEDNKDDQSSAYFDVLLASDIVYVADIIEPLWETVALLLKRSPTSQFVMAYCSKREVPVTIDQVLEGATSAGFSYHRVFENEEGILIYRFQWMMKY